MMKNSVEFFATLGRRIKDRDIYFAISQLKFIAKTNTNLNVLDELETIDYLYKQTLEYELKGISDPQRETIITDLIYRLYSINAHLADNIAVSESSKWEYSQLRNYKSKELFLPVSNDDEGYEAYLNSVFNMFWLSRDNSLIGQSSLSNDDFIAQQVAISGATLSLIRIFEVYKFNFLLSHLDSTSEEVRARTIVGILLTLGCHSEMLSKNTKLLDKVDIIINSTGNYLNFKYAILQIIRTSETKQANDKIENEIMPEMVKFASKHGKDIFNEDGDDDHNPNWDAIKNDKEFESSMQKMSNMQVNGVDINVSMFGKMKYYPFFTLTSNWLLPYYNSHPSVKHLYENNDATTQLLIMKNDICSSDKYSLSLMLNDMSDKIKQSISAKLSGEFEALQGEIAERRANKGGKSKLEDVLRFYIQDLYRFYNIYSNASEMTNPLTTFYHFLDTNVAEKLFNIEEVCSDVADYTFSSAVYLLASKYLMLLENKRVLTTSEIQKLAYSLEKEGLFEEAIEYYEKAYVIDFEDKWNIKRLAFCHYKLGNHDFALDYYKQLLENDEDNVKLLKNISRSYIILEKHSEALKVLYKIDYLEPNNTETQNSILWCYLFMQDFENAEVMFNKITNNTPSWYSWVLGGHISFFKKELLECYTRYKKGETLYVDFSAELYSTITNDLLKIDPEVDINEIKLIIDSISYKLM